ncbi:MAG: hypothetical protein WBZ07_00130, partial [Candidatus Dormiibacterota bacterium]
MELSAGDTGEEWAIPKVIPTQSEKALPSHPRAGLAKDEKANSAQSKPERPVSSQAELAQCREISPPLLPFHLGQSLRWLGHTTCHPFPGRACRGRAFAPALHPGKSLPRVGHSPPAASGRLGRLG